MIELHELGDVNRTDRNRIFASFLALGAERPPLTQVIIRLARVFASFDEAVMMKAMARGDAMIGGTGHIEIRGTIVAKAALSPAVLASHYLPLTAMTFCALIANDLVEDISYDVKD